MQFNSGAPMSWQSYLIVTTYFAILMLESLLYRWHRDSMLKRIFVVLSELALYTVFAIWYASTYPELLDICEEQVMLSVGYYLILLIPAITILWESVSYAYRVGYNRFWQDIYDKNIRPGRSLPMEQFRPLYFYHLKLRLINRYYSYRGDFYQTIFRILGLLVDILQLEALDDMRIRFGRWMNMQTLSRYLNVSFRRKTKQISLKLVRVDIVGSIATAEVYHIGLSKTEVALLVKKFLNLYEVGLGDKAHIKPLRRNYSSVIFPV